MTEQETGPKVEHFTRKMMVHKPSIDELMETNRSYLAEIGKTLGQQAAQQVEANLRGELQNDLDLIQDGQVVNVPMVHIK